MFEKVKQWVSDWRIAEQVVGTELNNWMVLVTAELIGFEKACIVLQQRIFELEKQAITFKMCEDQTVTDHEALAERVRVLETKLVRRVRALEIKPRSMC